MEAFRALAKGGLLWPCLYDHGFRSANVRADDVDYNLFVFDVRYQRIFTGSQPIKVEINFDVVVPYDVNGNALVLTNKLVSVRSGGQRRFDLKINVEN